LRFVASQTFAGVVVGGIHYDQARLIIASVSLTSSGDRVKLASLEMDQYPVKAIRDRGRRLAVDHRDDIPVSIIHPSLSISDFAGGLL